jgi:hypothetical protein
VVPEAKSTFESIASIHLYSLQPNSLQDLNVLLDIGREIESSFGNEDPLNVGIQWGMIQNENVKVCHRWDTSVIRVIPEVLSIRGEKVSGHHQLR